MQTYKALENPHLESKEAKLHIQHTNKCMEKEKQEMRLWFKVVSAMCLG